MGTFREFTLNRKVRELTVTLVFGDTTTARIFALPNQARIIDIIPNVKTAFSGGTAELDIGISGNGDSIADAISLATAGRVHPTTEIVQPGYETTDVTDIYASVGAGNTVGEVDVTFLFSYLTASNA